MKCKFCSAEWEGESTVCPECGKENEAITPEAKENTASEAAPKAASKMSAGRIALLAVLAVAAVAVVVALVYSSLKAKPEATEPTEDTTATTVATEPIDPNSVTAKATYTVSDDEAVAAHDTVVATLGDQELTNGMLQVYYWMSFYDFMNTYGDYAAYFGLDTSLPLDQQDCSEGKTWQQYFLDNALTTWQQFQSLSLQAGEEGFTLSAEEQELLDNLPQDLEETAAANGFDSVEEMMLYSIGPGATIADYQKYMYQYQLGYMFFESKYSLIQPTDAEIEAYFAENEETFAESGITKDSVSVDVRHVLLQPENGETDENGKTTYTDEAWEACRVKSEALLQQWLNGDATEDSFADMAMAESQDPGSASNGGLYTDVKTGDMVEAFDAWCFDNARKTGDYGLVKTEYGYHIMFFVQSNPLWYQNSKESLIAEQSNKIISDAVEKHQINVDYSAIVLGELPSDAGTTDGE